jgi:transposase-like protein
MAIRLLLTAGDLWHESTEAWLGDVEAWRDIRPTVVLTPQRAQGFYLRGRLVEQGLPLLGVRFWTPSDARSYLRGALQVPLRAATQGEQALIARGCAEKLLRTKSKDDPASLLSAAQDPASFLRAYDLLVGAGWSPSRDGAAYGKELAREFETTLSRARLLTQAGLHRYLREAAVLQPPPLSRVLVLGFNAAHWPLWDLLQAVCLQAAEAEVALEQAGEFGAALDDLWIGSWETFAGAAYEIPASEPTPDGPLASLASAYESGESTAIEPDTQIHFLASGELATQVHAVTLQALDYLRHPECTRLGLVFPEADALALGVAAQLRALDVPLDDGTGAIQPGPFESRPWQTWLELQEERTVRRLIAWLRACEAEKRGAGLPSLSAAQAARVLDRALTACMVDNLEFLTRQMELETASTESRGMALFLRKLTLLPDEGTVAGFLTATREALRRLDWNDLPALLPEQGPSGVENLSISRRTYLAWLRDVADSRERKRAGHHFYGKVHLLVYGQLAGQRWTHLILTGLNEGVWPRLAEGDAFGSRHEVTELNARARLLNRAGAGRGEQGEGHETVALGRGHCLLPLERYDLALRDLCRGLRATEHAVCLVARTHQQGRNSLPSDFLSHAWQLKTGQVLDDVIFRDLAKTTARHVHENAAFFPLQPGDAQDITATDHAFRARRQISEPFGRYEFAYATPPESAIQLSCKNWEAAFGHPASAWFSHVIGVGPWPEGNLSWKLSLGTWAHRWLAQAVNATATASTLEARVRGTAERDAHAVQKIARELNIKLYPWWRQLWAQSQAVALALAKVLVPELTAKKALAEIKLPRSLEIALPGTNRATFELRGKLDLLLLEPPTATTTEAAFDANGCSAWIIDFKTGSDSGLTEKRLEKGHGLQIALYGLALRALGAQPVHFSVLTPGAVLKRQLEETGSRGASEPFRTIEAMHRWGLFGQSDQEDRAHGFAPDYPMTTRIIPREVLKAKRALARGGEGA